MGDSHIPPKKANDIRHWNKRCKIITGALCLVVILLTAFVLIVYRAIDQEVQGKHTPEGVLPEEIKTDTIPEYKGKGIITGLICGVDYDNELATGYIDPENKIGNTDLILYMMYDTVNRKANILQIPRDTFVGEEVNTGGIGKINALYYYSDDPNNRMAALARVLHDQFKLPIDFYVTIDMDALKELVNQIGYIEIYVPHNITYKDRETGEEQLQIMEGWQNITSTEIESLVRNRNYPDSDIGRLRAQLSVYSALFREFKQLSATDLVMWMKILVYYINVDGISTINLGGLAQEAMTLSSEDITFVRPSYSGADYVPRSGVLMGIPLKTICMVPDEFAELLNKYFRPDGSTYTAEELDIYILPINQYGKGESEVRDLKEIQDEEPVIEE